MNTRPEYIPSSCPPENALDANNIVYRFIESDGVNPKDFSCYLKLYPNKIFEDNCKASWLSVYIDLEIAKLLKNRYPKKWKNIAEGKLLPIHWKIEYWNNSHATWWHYANIIPSSLFSLIDK